MRRFLLLRFGRLHNVKWALAWASTILLFTIYHGFKSLYSPSAKPSYVSTRAIVRAVRNAFLLGSLWAMLPLLFFSNASAGGQVIIACLCAGMLGGGAFAFASIPAAAIAFTTPIVIGSAIAIGRSGETAYILVSVLMVSYITVLLKGVLFIRRRSQRGSPHRSRPRGGSGETN